MTRETAWQPNICHVSCARTQIAPRDRFVRTPHSGRESNDRVLAGPCLTRKRNEFLATANFDERLPADFMLRTLLLSLLKVALVPLIPLWLVPGMLFHREQDQALSAAFTRRSLKVERGVVVESQKGVPLDKITDLALMEAPFRRHFGLCSLEVESSGGGQRASTGYVALIDVKAAIAFRDQVLAQRDAIVSEEEEDAAKPTRPARSAFAAGADVGSTEVLIEIRDSLRRVEAMVEDHQTGGS